MSVMNSKMEELFIFLDKGASLLEEHESFTYLEGLSEMGENLFQGEVVQPVTPEVKDRLYDLMRPLDVSEFSKEDIRKAFQLTVLKGMKGATQPNHSMTPDAVCLFLSYLVNKVMAEAKGGYSVLDLAAGSGNLLTALLNQSENPAKGFGFEVDETLLKLAFVSSNLQEIELELFHKDSIEPLTFPEVDLVVTDLPIGYYPHDEIAKEYKVKADEGHSFSHHLMIEKGINSVKEGGFLFYIVPNFLFESEQAPKLHAYLKEHAMIHGLLQLPKTMFTSDNHGKSILMLQKKGEGVTQAKQALLAELPSFSNKTALTDMMTRINKWFELELNL
ncbi:class I SAM-dependent methyltransferase [Alkalihalophilus marmarensis]|uniref:N-6 DNA methylase n=1 Tax=Alkalihalophilus marmarensis DSM 21297 TaxID=1188261 RepID=U6SPH9_9BACI|nr:class I SAM-dependent methyltransferase [Alkalihalophilus marmarensis]ERN52546.1 N-6 DNA methylase [Alkalihalophilus marmarensis DSM 21297]MCM3487761.1 class I SAM-dependent methyltransferase [Alkalihalophilus marmarensis]